MLLIARDITERRRAEEGGAGSKTKSRRAGSSKPSDSWPAASRTTSTTCAGDLGFADLTREYLPPGSPGLETLEKVTQAERARDLTQQLLTSAGAR